MRGCVIGCGYEKSVSINIILGIESQGWSAWVVEPQRCWLVYEQPSSMMKTTKYKRSVHINV
jgi:hypothetical protein